MLHGRPRAVNGSLSIVDNAPRARSNARMKTGAAAPATAPLAHPTIALLQTSSLASVAQTELERMILAGELAPGSRLTEMALAAQLGISRGPLREAFRMLEEAGLVRTEKNRGVFVRDIPIDEAVEIFELRATMDELVGRRLAEHITPAQLKEIRALVDAMERAVKAPPSEQSARGYHLLNLQFHDRLVEMAGNRKLSAIYRKLIKELSLFRRLNLENSEQGWSMPISAGEHRAIVKAIAAGDPEAAGRAMFDHVIKSKERTVKNHLHRQKLQSADAAQGVPHAQRQR
jgi:phosphonate utilization transcriptional regulator